MLKIEECAVLVIANGVAFKYEILDEYEAMEMVMIYDEMGFEVQCPTIGELERD